MRNDVHDHGMSLKTPKHATSLKESKCVHDHVFLFFVFFCFFVFCVVTYNFGLTQNNNRSVLKSTVSFFALSDRCHINPTATDNVLLNVRSGETRICNMYMWFKTCVAVIKAVCKKCDEPDYFAVVTYIYAAMEVWINYFCFFGYICISMIVIFSINIIAGILNHFLL